MIPNRGDRRNVPISRCASCGSHHKGSQKLCTTCQRWRFVCWHTMAVARLLRGLR